MKLPVYFLAILLTPAFAYASLLGNTSLSEGLPTEISDALQAAYQSKNNYVVEAVIKYSKDRYPTYEQQIDNFQPSIKEAKTIETKTAKVSPQEAPTLPLKESKEEKQPSKFSGTIDAGLNIANGNTKQRDINTSMKLNYDATEWSNTFSVTTRASSKDRVRTNEEYIVNNQTKYNITGDDYSFLELEYVNDVFSGFKQRTSELVGYGHKFLNSDDLTLLGEISGGARQSSLTDGNNGNSLLAKLSTKTQWKITDSLTFNNDTSSSFGSDAVITIMDNSLKTKIIETMYLKLNYNIQHVDDVAEGKNHIDTFTTLGVGYEF